VTTAQDTLERLGSQMALDPPAQPKRMLVIVNPHATTVSDRLKHLVVYALQARYRVDAVDTDAPAHATELCRAAAREGYDVVVAFGGDGTVNEAANGLAGSRTPLTCLPGGSANVYCHLLGIPSEVVDATEHLLRVADDWHPRAVDLARLGERWFAFSCGVGLDASVVRRVDAHPRRKARFAEWYFTSVAIGTFARRYLRHPPRLEVEVDGQRHRGVTAVVQNGDPYTYFGERPVPLARGATLSSGDLAGAVLRRASLADVPTLLWRALGPRGSLIDHRQFDGFSGASRVRVRSLDERPLPVQVDGDFIGERDEVEVSVCAGGLHVVS
jgi:diacylglycerol kinase family enzyme